MLASWIVRPVPLFLMQPALDYVVARISREQPKLFARMGANAGKIILIDPIDLPFVFAMRPDSQAPEMRMYRDVGDVRHDARIAGTLASLVRMIDTDLDGDALFFSRDLIIEGDVEAVVCLRNCLDDVPGSMAEDVARLFGGAGRTALAFLRHQSKGSAHVT